MALSFWIYTGTFSLAASPSIGNVVAQQLRARGHSLFYYSWDEPPLREGGRLRPREIDFLITRGYSNAAGKPRICPVEVKSSKAYSTVSLDDFAKRYSDRIGDEYVLHPKQLKVEDNRQYLPLYMSFCL